MKREERCRPEARATDLVRSPVPDNRTRRPARRVALLSALAAWAASAAGCAVSVPLSGLQGADAPTGSVDRTTALLSPALDREDLRRAKAAMAVALDPQGNGARVGWQNPQTGAHGGFAAQGSPFADRDRVCRRFSGEVVPAGGAERRLSGSACRDGDGSWRVTGTDGGEARGL